MARKKTTGENRGAELRALLEHLPKKDFEAAMSYTLLLAALRLRNPNTRTFPPMLFESIPDEFKAALGEIAHFYFFHKKAN